MTAATADTMECSFRFPGWNTANQGEPGIEWCADNTIVNTDPLCDIEGKLDELCRLRKNWDGYGSPPIDRKIIKAAKNLIKGLPPELISRTPGVVPVAGGNLQFEWDQGQKSLELEIEDPQTIHYLKWNPKEKIEEEGTFNIQDIHQTVKLIEWFLVEVVRV